MPQLSTNRLLCGPAPRTTASFSQQHRPTQDNVELPNELLLNIFASLDLQSLRLAANVSKSWAAAACDPSLGLWRECVLTRARQSFGKRPNKHKTKNMQLQLARALQQAPDSYLLRDSQLLFANALFFEQRDKAFARALFTGLQRALTVRFADYRALVAFDAEAGLRAAPQRACNNLALVRMRWPHPEAWNSVAEVTAFAKVFNASRGGEYFGHTLFARLRTCEVPAREPLWIVKANSKWLACHSELQRSQSWRQLCAQLSSTALSLLGYTRTSVRQAQGSQACLKLLAERLELAQVARLAEAPAAQAALLTQDLVRLGQQALQLAML